MIKLYGGLVAAALVAGAAWIAYGWAAGQGAAAERLVCDAEWSSEVQTLRKDKLQAQQDKLRAQQAVIEAQQQRAVAEAALGQQLEEQAHAYTQRIKSLETGSAGTRRELQRLRDALATARASLRHLSQPAAASAGPAADGAAADAGELLGSCGARLVELGGSADRLAAQVIGLQAYARIAQQSCGR